MTKSFPEWPAANITVPAANTGTATKNVRRVNVPLGDYYAVTDYFVQGRSFKEECWVTDLCVPPGGLKRATISIDPPDAKRQRLDTAASQSSTSTVGPPAVTTDSRSVTFHVTFTAGPTETNEDRLFAGAQSRYGSFIAGVNTAGQGIVIMQIDDVVLGRLESSHAFGHRVTFANPGDYGPLAGDAARV
ncbi:hypothetical protein VOLCADRAFT_101021 [Volvox carteri f. nagariensis]|uniref:Uncharacterized protein n=1 Tax=Volvox carteri f. nagariensis TaxID=3068 RepID=D8ULJ8_VOLCA|nr:uncharacterized protein VOLCADRAFT_101021 [Volvox carteri f. nagariensis]EFJ39401.1 hypothetical protein VOLCADRAFT_101021 [Volvox carteri f. nagariensis]|eukprot:XP_002959534.1 hypothetical protein VOLCADRAFT_101021 [Volvox carteri f. nagariensis]